MLTPEELDAEMSRAGHTDVEFAVKLQAAPSLHKALEVKDSYSRPQTPNPNLTCTIVCYTYLRSQNKCSVSGGIITSQSPKVPNLQEKCTNPSGDIVVAICLFLGSWWGAFNLLVSDIP